MGAENTVVVAFLLSRRPGGRLAHSRLDHPFVSRPDRSEARMKGVHFSKRWMQDPIFWFRPGAPHLQSGDATDMSSSPLSSDLCNSQIQRWASPPTPYLALPKKKPPSKSRHQKAAINTPPPKVQADDHLAEHLQCQSVNRQRCLT